MEVLVVPDAEAQILAIDAWWRENRPAAPALFAEELAAAAAEPAGRGDVVVDERLGGLLRSYRRVA